MRRACFRIIYSAEKLFIFLVRIKKIMTMVALPEVLEEPSDFDSNDNNNENNALETVDHESEQALPVAEKVVEPQSQVSTSEACTSFEEYRDSKRRK